MTPGNKKLRFEHDRSLKVNLKQYNVNIFGEDPLEISQLVEKLIRKLLIVFLHVQETLEANVSGILSGEG